MDQLPEIVGERLRLRAARDSDLPALLEVIKAPGSREWWGVYEGAEDDAELLGGWVIEIDGAPRGWLGFEEQTEYKYPCVAFDIMLATEVHGNGYGPEALRLAIRHFIAMGHHRFSIDPAAANARAIRAYEKTGFRPVGIARSAERDPGGGWRDSLLMDLLADDVE